jgi:hypothetical protein
MLALHKTNIDKSDTPTPNNYSQNAGVPNSGRYVEES